MTFPGVKNEQARADLIAYLTTASSGAAEQKPPGPQSSGMMIGGSAAPNLKKLDPEDRVAAVTLCGDTYPVRTADGKTQEFWERNLRFKTDSSDDGPVKGAPAIVGSGMMGDRASVVFASPDEISTAIKQQCE